MDKRIASWILEFLLRQPIEDWVPNMLLLILPVSNEDTRLKKTILLRRISSEISKNRVSEKILDSLDMIQELNRDIGTSASDSMKSAYCNVVVECTAQILRENSSDGEIDRFWKFRVSDGGGLVSNRLKEMEAVVGSLEIRDSLFSRNTLKEALDSVRVYLVEAMRDMGPAFLEFAAGLMFEESNVGAGTVEPEPSVEVDMRRKLPSSLIGTSEEGTLPRDRSQLDSKYKSLPSPEVNKVVDALKSSRIDLQNVVEDPLPDALEMATRVQSNMEREQINQKELEDKEIHIDADIQNCSVDKNVENGCVEEVRNGIQCNKNHDGVSRPSLMARNETARTFEWDDDTIDTISENSQNVSRRIRLPTPKHRAVSPLKKREVTRFIRRRRTKRWSSLEEETLRNGVAEYGKWNWKVILNCYREVFEDRTEYKGIKPASLGKVKDPGVKEFIVKCIVNGSERLPARELLMDPFLQSDPESESVGRSLRPDRNHLDDNRGHSVTNTTELNVKIGLPEAGRDFTVEGQRKDFNTIFLKLRISDSTGHVRNIHFPFDTEADTAISVASEMVAELDLTDQDVTAIAEMIDLEIQAHIAEWIPGASFEDNYADEATVSDTCGSEAKDELSALVNETDHPSSGYVLERLPSGRKYWCDSPRGASSSSLMRFTQSNLSSEAISHVSSDFLPKLYEDTSDDNKGKGDYPNGIASPEPHRLSTQTTEGSLEPDVLPVHSEEENAPCDNDIDRREKKGDTSDKLQPCGIQNGGSADLLCTDLQLCGNENGSDTDQNAGNENGSDLQLCGNGAPLSEESYALLMENEPEVFKDIAEKLDCLLGDQQKELDDLKRKHELAIADLLKELPPEHHDRILNMRHLKLPDYKMNTKVDWCSRHCTDSGSSVPPESLSSHLSNSHMDKILEDSIIVPIPKDLSQHRDSAGSSIFSRIVGKVGWEAEYHVVGSVFRDRSNFLKGDAKSSDMGIAVILGDRVAK